MSDFQNGSFRNRSLKQKIAIVIGIAILVIFALGFVFGVYFFGLAGLFKLLGIEYESVWSLVIFVISIFIAGIIIELFMKAVYLLTVENLTGPLKKVMIRFGFEFFTNWLVLFLVDEFMSSITISIHAEIIIAVVISVLEIAFDDEEEKNDR